MLRRCSAAVAILALAASCSTGDSVTSPGPDPDVVVGSFDFPESRLLGEIYAQSLEDEGLVVRRELGLGTRELVLPALRAGLIDVVPEYAGSALRAIRPDGPTPRSAGGAVDQLRAATRGWGLEVLAPAQASNQNVVVVPASVAERRGLRSIDDLAADDGSLVLGGPAECARRPLCLPGLRRTYGLTFADFVPLEGADQVAQALADGIVDVGVLFSTDPALAGIDLVALDDVRGLQPPDPVVPLARPAVAADPRAARALDAVSEALTTDGLRFLNWRVAEAGTDVGSEAHGWLVRRGLVAR